MNIAVLYCGTKVYSHVKDVYDVLLAMGHKPKYVNYDKKKKILEKALKGCEMVFNFCSENDEAEILEHLERMGIPAAGNSGSVVKKCSDKKLVSSFLEKNSILVPKNQLFTKDITDINTKSINTKDINTKSIDTNSVKIKNFKTGKNELRLSFPMLLKPVDEDASYFLSSENLVFDEKQFYSRLCEVLKDKDRIIAEEFIDGREFFVPLLGNPLYIPAISEICFEREYFSKNELPFQSFEVKWNKKDLRHYGSYSITGYKIDPETESKIKKTALKACNLLGCRGYASVNVMVNRKNEVYVIDVNANCDISYDSEFVSACEAVHKLYPRIIKEIIDCKKDY